MLCHAEDGIRDRVRSRGLGDVDKRQGQWPVVASNWRQLGSPLRPVAEDVDFFARALRECRLLYTSDAADERSSVDLGGRRIIKTKTNEVTSDILSLIYESTQRRRPVITSLLDEAEQKYITLRS